MGYVTSFVRTFGPGAALCALADAARSAWPYARLWVYPDAPLTRFLHARKGKAAWALVAGVQADAGEDAVVVREVCFELAARGFNVILYGRDGSWGDRKGGAEGADAGGVSTKKEQGQGQGVAQELGAFRKELEKMYPENRYRVVVAGARTKDVAREEEDEFVARVVGSLENINLTVLVEYVGKGGCRNALPPRLVAAVIPVLIRSAPALVIRISSLGDGSRAEMPFSSLYEWLGGLSRDGVVVVSCPLGEVASGSGEEPSLLRPTPRVLATAVLKQAAAASAAVVYPYWPHALLRAMQRTPIGPVLEQLSISLREFQLGGWAWVRG